MSNIFKLLTALIIATITISAQPVCSQRVVSELTSDTKFVSSSNVSNDYVIKIHSVNGNIVKAWILDVYKPAGRQKYLKVGTKFRKLGYSKKLWACNYSNDTAALLASADYDCNGNSIDSYAPSYPEYNNIIPDGVGEAKMKAVREMLEEQ